MGRGRAKAKQQKVARELKYNTHFTDLDALQRELGTSSSGGQTAGPPLRDADVEAEVGEDEYDDGYSNWTGTDR